MTAPLDLEELKRVAEAASDISDRAAYELAGDRFIATFDPPTVLALIVQQRALTAQIEDMTSTVEGARAYVAEHNAMEEKIAALTAQVAALRAAMERARDHYDLRSEMYTNDADCGAGMAAVLNEALAAAPGEPLAVVREMQRVVAGVYRSPCAQCSGDCASANPPVLCCPIVQARELDAAARRIFGHVKP